jgi:hypothetical protein
MVINSLDREYILNELRALKSELRDRNTLLDFT